MQPGPIPTLGSYRIPRIGFGSGVANTTPPLACAVAVIRWGADASSGVLRERARCTHRGHKGATVHHPGCGGADVGCLPFPKGDGRCFGNGLKRIPSRTRREFKVADVIAEPKP